LKASATMSIGADQFDHLVEREAVREHDRLGEITPRYPSRSWRL
jgi:hypothetical protein